MFRVRGLEVRLPTLTTWGLAVRKSRIQGQLKAELKLINNILTYAPPPSNCQDERGSWVSCKCM